MDANPYHVYEDAARDYLTSIHALMEEPEKETFLRLAEEIAEISAAMVPLAQGYLNAGDSILREGIGVHFIDQATVELLIGTALLQILQEEQTGIPEPAAIQATRNAALREAISAAEKSAAIPVFQGIPLGASYRITDAASLAESVSAFKSAAASTASSISHRVQELGGDITIDLVSGTQWNEVVKEASASREEIADLLGSIPKGEGALSAGAARASARNLLNAYSKIASLLDRKIETAARKKIGEWLEKIKQTEKVELFGALLETLYGLEGLNRSVERSLESTSAPVESINRASDLIKTQCDRFIVLIGRMRKFEDAVRLAKQIRIPQLLPTIISFQVALLAALVYAGYEHIHRSLGGTLNAVARSEE
jgi:hypothetical protein